MQVQVQVHLVAMATLALSTNPWSAISTTFFLLFPSLLVWGMNLSCPFSPAVMPKVVLQSSGLTSTTKQFDLVLISFSYS